MNAPTSFPVKPEPQETRLPQFAYNSNASNVKAEPSDVARVFLDRGLPVPSYAQNGVVSANSSTPEVGVAKQESYGDPTTPQDTTLPAKPKFFTVYESAADISHAPEEALKEGLGMVKTVKNSLKQLELGSKLRQEVWDRELANLESQASPRTLIAVCGATGAGKSSILNAILDDNIVPTSGMRACTAVVTELSYHKKSTVDADISFLSEAEWREELAVLLHDLVDEDGNIKRITDLKSDAGVAWQKVHAVYPKIHQDDIVKMSVNQIMDYDQLISRVLGTTKTISAKDSKAFAKEIGKYIDSKDQKRGKKDKQDKPKEPSLMDKVRKSAGMSSKSTGASAGSSGQGDADAPALWPLIRQVNVRCHAEALSTGAVLVDLPGVADANAARNNIAKDYMKKCNCIWILAPITRAVDDKTARDLLGDAFKIQLMSNYDDHTITFIASKCDDISCSEVIRALRLEDDPELEDIEARLQTLGHDISVSKKKKRDTERAVKAIEAELQDIRAQLREDEAHIEALENDEPFVSTLKKNKQASSKSKKRKNLSGGKKGSPKRRRSTCDSEDDDFIEDDSDNSSSDSDSDDDSDKETHGDDSDADQGTSDNEDQDEEMGEVTVEDLKEKVKQSKALIKATRERLSEARVAKKEAGDTLSSFEKSSSKVQKEKNAFCSLKRSEFSRDVLKEDFRVGLKDLDDAAAEERDPDNFNPNSNLRDYDAIDLPVFTCSSRDYVRLKGQVKGDGQPACFSNIEHTGIPDLQKWCHQLTISSRERSARTFMSHIKAFAQSVQSYVQGIGDVTAIDREALREKWESRGFDDPAEYDPNAGLDPLDSILGGLGGGLGAGLYTMNKPAPKVDVYGQPTGVTPRLCTEFAQLVDGCVRDLQQNFKDGLEDKCRLGAANAAESSLTTLDEFTSSMHWATYRATLRRHGSWRRDLNVELINPFTRNIAHSWSKVFESDLFAPFQASTISAITTLVKEVEESSAPGLKDRAKLQGETCVEEARVALTKAVELVKETMNREQKEVSRCMAPHVQAQLVEGYDTAMEERGTGSVARQKAYFRRYIDDCKDNIFDDGADVVLERLTKAAEAIGETLDEAMGKLAQKIEVSLAVLWEGARDNPAQLRARKAVIDVVETIQDQIKLWTEADKMKQEAARHESADAMDED
ncbi:hypothetical protein GALMADRAFT_236220 [Galerina marginata CBS 339.88]|uniref:G domain-containing protein n=1 Tax=Galerina marginata (strain CBS 339.88) TaxID=685588 RepID=A0A067TXQ0_GALM3|nr:hypothetical protein GALMADRAFT_236220 [Galerina marginata CBS 339.88]